ncbi:F-box protein [Spatholobus suberectus]|nr:F-box protein [Spatholobus suberectus]
MKDMERDINRAAGRQLQMAMEIMYDAERQTYTNWINELLSSLKSSTLQGLKFWFHVGTGCDVDKWVHFAIQKKVQKLELYFGHTFEYVLPLHLFKLASFNSLYVLCLKFITVTKEMLEYLLCCCPLLETLSLVNSGVPKTMKVSGPSLRLKCLELVRCWELIKLDIFAENLVSFKYYGSYLDTEFKSVPSLVEATFGGSFVEFTRESFLPQIKVLKLDITQNEPEVIYWLSQLPKLKNLKHLELIACVDDGITLGACAMLLKVSPSLWRFTLKILNTKPTFRTERKFSMECQCSLKELELVGFCGAASEVELVLYILEHAVELKKITIDTRLPTKPKLKPLGEHFKTWDHEENRKRVRKLQEKIPHWIEFVYL